MLKGVLLTKKSCYQLYVLSKLTKYGAGGDVCRKTESIITPAVVWPILYAYTPFHPQRLLKHGCQATRRVC